MQELIYITPEFAVGPQPADADFRALKDAGFAAVLNARLDDELGDYLKSGEAREMAERAGLAYANSPTENHAIFEPEVIDRFERELANLPKPVFAHCKTGTRSTILWALVAARHRDVEGVIETLRAAGQELDFLEDEMRDSANSVRKSPLRLRDDALMTLGRSGLLGGEPEAEGDGPEDAPDGA